jgi:large subunit ribosomal protein L15
MTVSLNNLTYNKKSRKRRKVVGRGNASGHGTYSCRGGKGQTARSGSSGLVLKGMKRMLLRLPKFKGMKPHAGKQAVTLEQINQTFIEGAAVNPQTLVDAKLIKTVEKPVKILSTGEIGVKIEVTGCRVTDKAKAAIEKVGGKVILPEAKKSKSKK